MATSLAARGTHAVVKGLQGEIVEIPFTFTTGADSGGNPALVYDYGDSISMALVEGTPDAYVITIGPYKQFLAAPASHNLGATVNLTLTYSATNGTVTYSCTANTLISATVSGVIYVIK